jgi:hypothetical protein
LDGAGRRRTISPLKQDHMMNPTYDIGAGLPVDGGFTAH